MSSTSSRSNQSTRKTSSRSTGKFATSRSHSKNDRTLETTALPPRSLPNWVAYEENGGRGHKLPVGEFHHDYKGPVYLSTGKMNKTIFKSNAVPDFDTHLAPRELLQYRAERDPSLREYFKRPNNRKFLKYHNIINDQGEVLCSLKEYNAYRKYLDDQRLQQIRTVQSIERDLAFPPTIKPSELEAFDFNRNLRFQAVINSILPFHRDVKVAERHYLKALNACQQRNLTEQQMKDLDAQLQATKWLLQTRTKHLDRLLDWIEVQQRQYELDKHLYELKMDEPHQENVAKFELRSPIQQVIKEEEDFKREVMETEHLRRIAFRAKDNSEKHCKLMREVYNRLHELRRRREVQEQRNMKHIMEQITKSRGSDTSILTTTASDTGPLTRYVDNLEDDEIERFMTDVFSVNWHAGLATDATPKKKLFGKVENINTFDEERPNFHRHCIPNKNTSPNMIPTFDARVETTIHIANLVNPSSTSDMTVEKIVPTARRG